PAGSVRSAGGLGNARPLGGTGRGRRQTLFRSGGGRRPRGHDGAGRRRATKAAMRVSIVGLGKVGSALASALAIQGVCEGLVLVGRRVGFREGEAHDLRHASSFFRHRISVRAGDLAATHDSDILILSASHPAPVGSVDRTAVAAENTRLFAELVPRLVAYSPEATILVVTNPV